jgi:ABC-2 type transport system ATP-binding protein
VPWFVHQQAGDRSAVDAALANVPAPYPCVVKPAALSGSRGVIRADDAAALAAAYERLCALAPRFAELCERLEMSEATLRRPVRDYSRGMRQKIGIIQALQHDPELAILDEPTEGLDPLMQRAFYGILETLKAEGRTIFFSSHVLSEVERVCDRVAIIRRGRLVATEEIAGLLARRKRNVEMRLQGAPPRLDGVPGVSSVEAADGRLTCRVEGDMRPFLAAIATTAIVDLTIEPAHLEDAFLELYEETDA